MLLKDRRHKMGRSKEKLETELRRLLLPLVAPGIVARNQDEMLIFMPPQRLYEYINAASNSIMYKSGIPMPNSIGDDVPWPTTPHDIAVRENLLALIAAMMGGNQSGYTVMISWDYLNAVESMRVIIPAIIERLDGLVAEGLTFKTNVDNLTKQTIALSLENVRLTETNKKLQAQILQLKASQ